MAMITVYAFTIYNPKNDNHEMARGMATKETIAKIKGATVIETKSKNINDSELSQSERYHE